MVELNQVWTNSGDVPAITGGIKYGRKPERDIFIIQGLICLHGRINRIQSWTQSRSLEVDGITPSWTLNSTESKLGIDVEDF